jgi:hypothetical protein
MIDAAVTADWAIWVESWISCSSFVRWAAESGTK